MAKKAEFVFVGDADSVIRAATKAKAATNSLAGATDKDAKRMGSSYAAMGNAAKLAGVAIVGGLVVGVKKSVDAFQESEKSHARMTAQLKASGVSYRAHGKEIDAVIQKTSRLAALDDEDLQDAFTNIVRSTGSVSKSLKLTGLAADLARAKHLRVAKAGELVAKVAGGNVGALKRLGIAFDPVTKAQDALAKSHSKATVEQKRAAKESDKQATSLVALASLQSRVAGQAKAYGETSAGAQDRFRVAVQNLEEKIGSGLRPAITTVANAAATFITQLQDGTGAGGRFLGVVRGLVKPIQDVVKGFKEGKTWAVALVAGLGGLATGAVVIRTLVAVTRTWAAAQVALNIAMTANPIGLVIAGIAAFGVAVVIAYKKSATFRAIVQGAWKGIKAAGKWLVAAAGDVADFARSVGHWIGVAASNVHAFPGKVLSALKSLPGKMLGIGEDLLTGLIDGIKNKAGDVISTLKNYVTDKIPGFVKKAFEIFSPSRVMFRLGGHIGQGLADGIRAKATAVKGAVDTGLLFPLDAALRELNAKKDKLQASFDAWDKRRERQSLVAAIGTARTSGTSDGANGSGGMPALRGGSVVSQLSNLGRSAGLSVTSTTGGKHVSGSYHYKGEAVDLAGPPARMMEFAKSIAAKYGSQLAELFYDPLGFYVKNGKRVKGAIGGHGDHVHVAMTKVLASTKAASGVAGQALAVARKMNATRKQTLALIEAGIVESGMKNLKGGDRDSVGFLQQRASQGWTGLTNVPKAAAEFLRHAKAADRGGMSAGQLAQAVQRSAFPGRYDQVKGRAAEIIGGGISGGVSGRVAGGDGSSITDAIQALKDFDRQTARTNKMSKLDIQIQGIEKVKAFKTAIEDLRTSVADKLNEAVDKFRTNWENTTGKAIDAANALTLKGFDAATDSMVAMTAASQDLARLRGIDGALAVQKEDADNAKALADAQFLVAHSGGKVHADALVQLADAQAQIEATQRRRQEDALEAQVATETAAIQEQRATERAALEDQFANARAAQLEADVAGFQSAEQAKLNVLTSSLEAQRLTYADYVRKVNALLAGIGASGIDPSADQEAILAGGGSVNKPYNGYGAFTRPRKHATGGWTGLVLNELGPERVYVNRSGGVMVQQASEVARGGGGGGTVNYYGDVRIGSARAARVHADRTAFRLRFG